MRINNNLPALSANKNVKRNTERLTESMKKLSSGMRVNSFADDAAGGAISEKMRAQIRGLQRANLNVQDGISLVHTGDAPMQEIQNSLHRMRELAVKAANDTHSDMERDIIQREIDVLAGEIDDIAKTTIFNDIHILDDNWTRISHAIAGPFVSQLASTTTVPQVTTTYVKIPTSSPPLTPTSTSMPGDMVAGYPTHSIATETDASVKGSSDYGISNMGNMNDYEGDSLPNISTVLVSNEDVTVTSTTLTQWEHITDITSESKALSLKNNVNNYGYPQFKTEDNLINLYCAMTQLSVQIDGQYIPTIYNSTYTNIPTVYSDNDTKATTVFLVQDVKITQTITLDTIGNKLNIDLAVENVSSSTVPKNVDVKFAFDALNGYQQYSENNGTTFSTLSDNNAKFWKPPSGDEVLSFQNDDNAPEVAVKFKLATSGVTASQLVLDNIETMHNKWDYAADSRNSNHSAVGVYWEGINLTSGATANMGVSYGEPELFVNVYEIVTTTETVTTSVTTNTKYVETSTYKANDLIVQTGANTGDELKIPLMTVNSKMLEVNNLSVHSHKEAGEAISKLDKALNFMSTMRSVWGALENRMDEISIGNDVSAENLTSAFSLIKDVDMAKEITEKMSADIAMQASTAMLAQANSQPQSVLQLLQ